MARKRYKEQGTGTCFGEYLYDRPVTKSHSLRKLEALVDWEVLSENLVRLYQCEAQAGRRPYDPAVVLKMLLLSHLYNPSEGQTWRPANSNGTLTLL